MGQHDVPIRLANTQGSEGSGGPCPDILSLLLGMGTSSRVCPPRANCVACVSLPRPDGRPKGGPVLRTV